MQLFIGVKTQSMATSWAKFRSHLLSIRLPSSATHSGKQFFNHAFEDNYARLHYENIAVVHNNYIKGHGPKRSRLENYHLWDVGNIMFPTCGERSASDVSKSVRMIFPHAPSQRWVLWGVWAVALMTLCGCGLCPYVGKTLMFKTGRRVRNGLRVALQAGPSVPKGVPHQTPSF